MPIRKPVIVLLPMSLVGGASASDCMYSFGSRMTLVPRILWYIILGVSNPVG